MKRLIILSTILITILGCSVNEKPEFQRVENIKVLESNSQYVLITADALFINPNDIGGNLKTDEIKVIEIYKNYRCDSNHIKYFDDSNELFYFSYALALFLKVN